MIEIRSLLKKYKKLYGECLHFSPKMGRIENIVRVYAMVVFKNKFKINLHKNRMLK